MAINETVTGNDSVAITGTASAGERTVGVKGKGDSVGVRGEGKGWHGVEGISDSTIGGFGVCGAHTAGGTGVVGESSGWIAVGGFAGSESKGAAVYGEHKGNQAGVWGHNVNPSNQAGPGVVGTSKGTGVWGESTTWMGVYGKSASTTGGAGVMGEATGTGAGVYGKGGRVAGFFEGNVEITGDLTTRGVSFRALLQRIQQLEQKVAALENGSGGTTTQAFVSTTLETDPPGSGSRILRITGSDFQAGEQVRLSITTKVGSDNPFTEIRETIANSVGNIDFKFSGSGGGVCFPGQSRTFQVQATGLTSSRKSNIATNGC